MSTEYECPIVIPQLWDPETGYLLHQFTSPRNSSFNTIKPLPSSQTVLAAATSDLHLRHVTGKLHPPQGLIYGVESWEGDLELNYY